MRLKFFKKIFFNFFLFINLFLAIRGEVGQMIVTTSDKQLLIVEKRKLLLPPNYTRYFSWGYLDHSARIASVEGDKVIISLYAGFMTKYAK